MGTLFPLFSKLTQLRDGIGLTFALDRANGSAYCSYEGADLAHYTKVFDINTGAFRFRVDGRRGEQLRSWWEMCSLRCSLECPTEIPLGGTPCPLVPI